MPVYTVIDKTTGERGPSYDSPQPSFLELFPPVVYDHVPQAEPEVVAVLVTRYGGRRAITHEEMRNLFTEEERWSIDAFEVGYEAMPLPTDVKNRIRSGYKSYYAAQFVDLDDPKVSLLLGVFVGLQLITYARMEEILNG